MAKPAAPSPLAGHARRLFTDELVKGLPNVVAHIQLHTRELLDRPAEYLSSQRRRDLVQGLRRLAPGWQAQIVAGLRHVLQFGVTATLPTDVPNVAGAKGGMSLVDNDTIEREILTSRLALAIMDRASWEFTDLRSRIASLEQRQELDIHDMLRAHVLARVVLDAWRQVGMTATDWREAQQALHEEFALLAEEAYHETNRWLIGQKVMHDVDLRPFIRRNRESHGGATGAYGGGGGGGGGSGGTGEGPTATGAALGRGRAGLAAPSGGYYSAAADRQRTGTGAAKAEDSGDDSERSVGEETRMMTRASPLGRGGSDHAEAVLGRLNRLIGRHLPSFSNTSHDRPPVGEALSRAINSAQRGIRQRLAPQGDGSRAAPVTAPQLMAEFQQRKQALKDAATSPNERATIEVVAMMFQSILTEDGISAAMRVWFARLQMPVLRVAVSEPDFFATIDHPARRLIDRMGACVMGLDSASRGIGDALEVEIKRVVQVVEAYPDTGRRVFQTVLVEFEKFLEHFFKNENAASKKGVSLAQQVEQRETLAIQFTIELRRMLNDVPVQEGVRMFLFQVWADVLAMGAVRYGRQSAEIKSLKKAASELIWSASAKVTRDERADVLRRLPPLLKRLREGMASSNMSVERQDERIQALNNALAAAFTAKAAVIPNERLNELMERLESIEELLPDSDEALEIDESMVLDLSGHESSELEVVSDGGTLPTPPMLAWARELLVGSWYMLDFRNRNEPVQLSWHGMKRQLTLFVTPAGRCVLFQQNRLAAFLQAGLLVPAQDEALTVKATRTALAKLDADPSRLMN